MSPRPVSGKTTITSGNDHGFVGTEAFITVNQVGGAGGAATSGAKGGAGAASTLINAVTGSATDDGSLFLTQAAVGGAGGSADTGTAGAAGAASSALTFSDVAAATKNAGLNGTSNATGGAGGAGTAASGIAGGQRREGQWVNMDGLARPRRYRRTATGGAGEERGDGAGHKAGAGGAASAIRHRLPFGKRWRTMQTFR